MSSRKYTDQSLKSLIGEMLKNSGMEKKFNELEVIACYKKAVGDVISKKTREVFLRNRTLVLKMDSGALKQELHFEKKRIIALINEQLEAPFIEELEVW